MVDYNCSYRNKNGEIRHAIIFASDAFHARILFEEMVGSDSACLIGIEKDQPSSTTFSQ